jgi:hypothetical protein
MRYCSQSENEYDVWKSVRLLESWIRKNGYAGYDPYDIRESPFLRKIEKIKSVRRFVHAIELLNPLLFRRIFHIKKKIYAKGMGLFADAYLNLFEITGQNQYRLNSEECISWLSKNYLKGYSGRCWGYPFDWRSKVLIPKNTPSGVVTSIVGNAYWNFYKSTNNRKYLNACEEICLFFIADLNIDKIGKNKICFSYTPIDNFHVNNANLFVAEFLLRVGNEINNPDFIDKGLAGINYTLSEQNNDGSFFYWGKDQYGENTIDHYHTGFELRSLYSAWQLTGERRILDAVKRYYDFYLIHMFLDNRIPKITPHRLNPVDIHSCAEAILCNTLLSNKFSEGILFLKNSVNWTIKNMQEKNGSFIYRLFILHGIKLRVVIPYIRWGQAWMLNALSSYMLSYFKNK